MGAPPPNPRRPSEAPELDEGALVAELRRRSHEKLAGPRVEAVPEPPITMGDPERVPHSPPIEIAPPSPALEPEAPAPEPHAKRKRAPRREADGAPGFRRRAWSWLKAPPAPAKRKRAPKAEAPPPDAARSLRRNAWWWLRPRPSPAPLPAAAPPEVEAPKRRRTRKDAVPEGIVDLRRRAWAWFAPRATGESAAGTHAPARVTAPSAEILGGDVVRTHLKGVLEALVFASEHPLPARELARVAQADLKLVKTLLAELMAEYHARGLRLDEVAGGFVFRTSPVFAPFVREQVAKKPVKMSRAQIETLAICAYRQPITRPEIDDVRGVDSGAVLKSLLERGLVRILGKKDEPGRPMLYGTTPAFLEFFGLKALGDLPTLREFTELTDESKRTYERELGEDAPEGGETGLMGGEGDLRAPAAPAEKIDLAALEEDPTLEPPPPAAPAPPDEAAPLSEPPPSAHRPEPPAAANEAPEQDVEEEGEDDDEDEDEDGDEEDDDDDEDEEEEDDEEA
jgi:segregation and condensation protein B